MEAGRVGPAVSENRYIFIHRLRFLTDWRFEVFRIEIQSMMWHHSTGGHPFLKGCRRDSNVRTSPPRGARLEWVCCDSCVDRPGGVSVKCKFTKL